MAKAYAEGLVLVSSNKGCRKDSEARPRANCTIPRIIIRSYRTVNVFETMVDVFLTSDATWQENVRLMVSVKVKELTLIVVNTTAVRVPSRFVAIHKKVTNAIARQAVSFIDQSGIASRDASSPVRCQKSRLIYSAKMSAITPFPPGFNAVIAVQAKR